MKTQRNQSKVRNRAVALVITLAILVLLLLIFVAFVSSVRIEKNAASNYSGAIKAKLMADSGLDDAMALLQNAFITPGQPAPDQVSNHVTFPGRVYNLQSGPGTYNVQTNDLFSGGNGINLNDTIYGAVYPIAQRNADYTNDVPVITAGFKFVREGANNGTGKIIGRYAYWIDDDSSKINMNVANNRSGYLPEDMDWKALKGELDENDDGNVDDDSDGDGLNDGTEVEDSRPFLSPAELNNILPGFYDTNRFYMTLWGAGDNELNIFGRQRFNIQTNALITNSESLDLFETMVDRLMFSNDWSVVYTNWSPANGGDGGLLSDKYTLERDRKQIVANLVSFHYKGAESITDAYAGGPTEPTFIGVMKSPYFHEVAADVWLTNEGADLSTPGNNNFRLHVNLDAESINPYPTNFTGKLVVDGVVTGKFDSSPDIPFSTTFSKNWNALTFRQNFLHLSTTNISANSRKVLENVYSAPSAVTQIIELVVTANIRMRIGDTDELADYTGNASMPRYSLLGAAADGTNVMAGASGSEVHVAFSIGKDDPRVRLKQDGSEWVYMSLSGGTGNTLGTTNRTNAAFTNQFVLATDWDYPFAEEFAHSDVPFSDAGFNSIGDLGYIHVNQQWKTLRMQKNANESEVADWVLLDDCTMDRPTDGKFNINTLVYEQATNFFRSGTNAPYLSRPLSVLFTNTFIENNDVEVFSNFVHAVSIYSTNKPFWTIGELCEITNSAGDPLIIDEDTEAVIRDVGNQITVRGDVFTIWVVGQAIRDLGTIGTFESATDQILGEQKIQAVVKKNGGRMKVLYFRYVTE